MATAGDLGAKAAPKAIAFVSSGLALGVRIQMTLDSTGNQAITADMLGAFSSAARDGLRMEGGGYRRDHLRAFARRVEVADTEIRITGSKSELLRTLMAASNGKSAAFGLHRSVLKWRTRHDSNV